MPRIRTLTTVLFLIIVPSLFIYYFYYDSVSSSIITRYQPSSSTEYVQQLIDGDGAQQPPSSLPQQQQQLPPMDDPQHKYAAVWRHATNIYNHPASNVQNDSSTSSSLLRSSATMLENLLNRNREREFTYAQITPPSMPSPNETMDPDPEIESHRQFVKKMMKEAWDNYVLYAWGYNELQPQSRNKKMDSIFGPTKLGLTIVDSMDTLFLMDMKQEFELGRQWVAQELDFESTPTETSVFETIIRYVGGLLTCFALTGDPMFLYKSRQVAQALLPAYNTATGIPNGLIIPKTGKAYHHTWASGAILSEFGSHHLEYTYLSDMTGDRRFHDRVKRIRSVLNNAEKPNGLYLLMLDEETGRWTDNKVSLGALGDSFYEYLIKAYVQSGHRDRQALQMYTDAMDAIDRSGMINQSASGHLTYVSDLVFGKPTNKMQHLTCFAGGMYMLGVHHMAGNSAVGIDIPDNVVRDDSAPKTLANLTAAEYSRLQRHFGLAVNLTETCYQSYHRTPTHLGPESFYFNEKVEAINPNGDYYILRPEVIESYFIMWRLTHDNRYREYAWEAAQAIYEHCRTESGYAGIYNVMHKPAIKDNTQQSFFLAETLKYLYLIFSNDKLLSLDEWVFNTEAHPLPICGHNSAYPASTCINNNNNNNNGRT
ncbi:hypothetical protein HUG17_2409 [Dermatophagoides farinae]|uniref:alpha-1,2-Mannosidase n=2 Tax=Dermatophagoides farinae TaxID=6954 RepID=A0A9D4SE54_DERFA|nr:mannosyl-oligosaccharide alpha-1,2-mannosidase IA-like [Dermatophagoides farinae]XP_046909549.1 mannosyl-oligosaccharide alpha-1,2-mannosidase IA-like [Dermatophagoides farinae]XP_046909550.1 mannosyl-oligosaccharide alpha-1,2-mannosidase IA-like [Dermatophagoides farinae]XP_046909551.1 mannosyl-oligosaccharide alpha-1,2-mannosidase IA-like [Dermatophagoides farinae]XP_046909552.1 mannosyl-oligosaccharide alpha-1,2-mannosidase IA-like [Dermatophagoides farinae]XP_046909553.1 mannosyl-oligos